MEKKRQTSKTQEILPVKIKCDGIAFYSPKTIMLFAPIIISKTKKV